MGDKELRAIFNALPVPEFETTACKLLRHVRQTLLEAGEAHELYHSVVPRSYHALPEAISSAT